MQRDAKRGASSFSTSEKSDMASRVRAKNFSRMLGRSFVVSQAYVVAARGRTSQGQPRNDYVVEHVDGTAHRSSEPRETCRRIAASNPAPQFSTEDGGDYFVRHGGNNPEVS